MENWRILVVEDDPDGQDLLSRLFDRHQIDYDIAYRAERALELLAEHTYTGVVIDLNLPGMDGWQFIQALHERETTSKLPCVAITAYHNSYLPSKAREAGFVAYIPKPLEVRTFVQQLQQNF